jgi:hypothetical protein
MPIKNPGAVLELLAIASEHDHCEAFWWRCDAPRYDPVTFLVNCNDFFYPGADAEEIAEEDIPEFRRAFEECAALDAADKDHFTILYAPELFVARKRKMRPWQRKLEKCPDKLKALFDNPGWEQYPNWGKR